MKSLMRVSRQPLYQQVRQILLKTIQSGAWKPSEKIQLSPFWPSKWEHQLEP